MFNHLFRGKTRGKARGGVYILELGTLSKRERESIKMGCYWHFATALLLWLWNGILDPSKILLEILVYVLMQALDSDRGVEIVDITRAEKLRLLCKRNPKLLILPIRFVCLEIIANGLLLLWSLFRVFWGRRLAILREISKKVHKMCSKFGISSWIVFVYGI